MTAKTFRAVLPTSNVRSPELEKLITPGNCKKIAGNLGFKIFPDELNIWGIRTPNGEWDDYFLYFYDGKPDCTLLLQGTTEPDINYINTLMASGKSNPNGIATLTDDNQFINCWQRGLHKGKYKALIQVPGYKFPVWRTKKSGILYSDKVWYDVQGLNHHTTKLGWAGKYIGGWSEGCQVVYNASDYFDLVIPLIFNANQKFYSYTLIQAEKFNSL